jgi:integrase
MVLHRSMEDALRLELVRANPTHNATTPRIPDSVQNHWYSDEQIANLLQATEGDRFHALWVILSTLGLRLGEALALQWSDIDLERRTLAVRRSLQRSRDGEGLGFHELKTKGSRRTLTLGRHAIEALQMHRDRQDFEKKKAEGAWHDQGLIFTTKYGLPLDQKRIHENWGQHVKQPAYRATASTTSGTRSPPT